MDRSRKRSGWRLLWISLFFWLVPALACNYPRPESNGQGLSQESLRQTLAALPGAATPTVAGGGSGGADLPTLVNPTASEPPSSQPLASQPPATGAGAASTPSPTTDPNLWIYSSQPGDTLPALAERFGVEPASITSKEPIPAQELIPAGQVLSIPNQVGQAPYPGALLPDSELVYSPTSLDFDARAYIQEAGGYLATYLEDVDGEEMSGAGILLRVAQEYSVNPRLLLALLEFRSGWVLGQPRAGSDPGYPLGLYVPDRQGLYQELGMTAKLLNLGYYGWRGGSLTEIKFQDSGSARLSPVLNAGSIALQYLFSRLYKRAAWESTLYGADSLLVKYASMFGDPWARARSAGPLFPEELSQPELELPFQPGENWALTGGPHDAWNTGTPWGAIDLAPATGERPCSVSRAWVTASAAGTVVRSDHNAVILDLDGDGNEQTGWVLFYYHLAAQDIVPPGSQVALNDRLGHPSCEGSRATGTHVHLARKYNGEWLPAGWPIPMLLSGWQVVQGAQMYKGSMVRGEQQAVANINGPRTSIVIR